MAETKLLLKGSPGYYAVRVPVHVPDSTKPILFSVREMSDELQAEYEEYQDQQLTFLQTIGAGDAPQAMAAADGNPDLQEDIRSRVFSAVMASVLQPGGTLLADMRRMQREEGELRDRIVADALVSFPSEVRSIDDNGVETTPAVTLETVKLLPLNIRQHLQNQIIAASGLSQSEQDFLPGLLGR